jgi:hypothetical protein
MAILSPGARLRWRDYATDEVMKLEIIGSLSSAELRTNHCCRPASPRGFSKLLCRVRYQFNTPMPPLFIATV